jgi:uncharacterized protein (TIGR02996 family)
MSDHDAFRAAICATPEDDALRLVYADFLEENGDPDYAAFIRAQIDLARCDPWEPFAVLCRWRRPDWLIGNPFRRTLPPVDGFNLEWHAHAFQRGLGWSLNIRSLFAWEKLERIILAGAPVGEVHLWGAPTLDDWRQFAASPLVPRLRRVSLMANPIEPLRILRDHPASLGIEDIWFARASGAGMPVVVEDLFRSPLGQVISGLWFQVGYESLHQLLEAIAEGAGGRLRRLGFSVMGFTSEHVQRLSDGGTLDGLTELSLENDPLGNDGAGLLASRLGSELRQLRLTNLGVQVGAIEALVRNERLASLRQLDLSSSSLSPRAMRLLSLSKTLAGLRSIDLSACHIGDKGVRHLTRARFWQNLVEIALHHNPISRVGLQHLLDAPVPPELTALVLDHQQAGSDSVRELRKKYGERLVLIPRG